MIALPTASQIERALRCAGSVVLPQVPSSNADADLGTAIHAFLARARAEGRDAALAAIADEAVRQRCAGIDLEALPAGAEGEVPLAWDPEAGEDGHAERLDLPGHRAYPHDGRRYFGTADLAGALDEETGFVADFKSGQEKVTAVDSEQLRTLAVMVAAMIGASAVVVMMLHLRHNGGWRTTRGALDAFDLSDQRARLRELRTRLGREAERYGAGDRPQLAEGPWCEHCEAISHCPAKVTLALALVGRTEELEARTARTLTPEEKGQLYHQAQAVREVLERVEAYLRAEAKRQPIPLGGGRVYAEIPWSTRRVDRVRALPVLERFGPEIAEGAQTITLASVKRSFVEAGRGEEAKGAEEALARSGALVRVRATQIRVVLAKEGT